MNAPGLFSRVAVALVLTALTPACGPSNGASNGASNAEPALSTTSEQRTSATVVAVAGAARVRLAGRLVLDDATALVVAPMQARIVRLVARPGTAIAAGATVVDVVLPEVLSAAADIVAADARQHALEQRKAQLASLRAAGLSNLSDEVDLALALADLVAMRARSEATLQRAGQRADHAAALLAAGTVALRAPAGGVVASVVGVIGDVLDSGELIATIVAHPRADGIRVVARSTGTVEDATIVLAGSSLPLGLGVVVPRVQAGDGAQEVWWRLAPASVTGDMLAHLVDGGFVAVIGTSKNGLRVPRSAVLVDGAGTAVAVKNADGAFVRTTVEVVGRPDGDEDGRNDVVVVGIEPGVAVATTPRAVLEAT